MWKIFKNKIYRFLYLTTAFIQKMFNQNESKIINLHAAIENNLTLSKQQISDFLDAFSICKYIYLIEINVIILKFKLFFFSKIIKLTKIMMVRLFLLFFVI